MIRKEHPLRTILLKVLKILIFAFCIFWMFILIFVRVVGYDRAVVIVSELTGFSTDDLIADSTEHSNDTLDSLQTQGYELYFWASLASGTFGALVLSQGRSVFEIVVLFVAFAIPKQRRYWGRVRDTATGKAVAFATIRLFDKASDKFISQTISDLDGQYRIPVTDNTREYRVEAIAEGFAPFKIDIASRSAETINKEIIIDIPLVQTSSNGKPTLKILWEQFRSQIYVFTLVFMYLFNIGGIAMSVYGIIANPSPTDYITLVLYVGAFVWNNAVVFDRLKLGVGKIYEAGTKNEIEGVQINIFDQDKQILSVSTHKLNYTKFDLPAGIYTAEISKPGYKLTGNADGKLTKIKVRNDGYLAQNVYLERTGEKVVENPTADTQLVSPFG